MEPASYDQPAIRPALAWVTAALAGIVAPVIALTLLGLEAAPGSLAGAGGPILAVGIMGAGMISAAIAGRFWLGIVLALLAGAALLMLAGILAMPGASVPLSIVLIMLVASISFAARGTLFARSGAGRGWWIAVFVVGGEAAMLLTAWAMPGALPDWLLVLLPAQWASMAVQSALGGNGILAASSALIALGGTAVATLLVWRLWPRRWPYAIMFTTWIGLSALVWHWPVAA
ncbi:hypothetical protein [Erythrobacter aurantius]|uniref:hypothetical protein n=1 Tax=Erythrobacter aurantius TaxID=2909249 RepID=UPI002079A286|nr:hypothetical protein [Erythrobacter aurantius]